LSRSLSIGGRFSEMHFKVKKIRHMKDGSDDTPKLLIQTSLSLTFVAVILGTCAALLS
jgi:hypothetical protein